MIKKSLKEIRAKREIREIKGDTGAKGDQGLKGDTGDKGETGNGIASVELTSTAGLVKTYTITFTDATTTTFTVTDGSTPEITFQGTTIYVDGVAGPDPERGKLAGVSLRWSCSPRSGWLRPTASLYRCNDLRLRGDGWGGRHRCDRCADNRGSIVDVMSQKAVTDEIAQLAGEVALKVDKSTQGMKLLADYILNSNIILPQIQSIDYATSTVTFTAPHGITVLPGFYSHACCAYINDYRIKTNYKAVPSGLQVDPFFKIVEIISPTVLRFSNVAAGTTYALPNTNPTDVDFSMWHFEYMTNLNIDIIIENSVAVKAVVMARSHHGHAYLYALGNETSKDTPSDVGTLLGLGTAYWERDFFHCWERSFGVTYIRDRKHNKECRISKR